MARKKKGVVEADERGFNYAQNRLSKKAQEALAAGRVKALEELLLEEEMANTKDPAEKNVVNGQLSRLRGRTFTSTDDFMSCWEAFVDEARHGGYEMVPTYLSFAEWAGATPECVYNYIKSHSGVASRCAESMADCLVEGCMKKQYQNSITIFTLKNRCGWADKREDTTIHTEKNVATKEEAKNKILELVRNDRDAREVARMKVVDENREDEEMNG